MAGCHSWRQPFSRLLRHAGIRCTYSKPGHTPGHPSKVELILPTSEEWQPEATPPGVNSTANTCHCGYVFRIFRTKANKFVVLWRYTPIIWNKGKQIGGVVEIYSDYLEPSETKLLCCRYFLLWIWCKDSQIYCIVEICSDYLNNGNLICGIVEICYGYLKQRSTNMWYCADILRIFDIKVNKYVVLWRYTPIIWNKVFFFFVYIVDDRMCANAHYRGVIQEEWEREG